VYNTTLHHFTQKQESRGGCLGIILYIRGDQHSFAGEGVGEPDSDERTDTMVLYVNDKNSKRKQTTPDPVGSATICPGGSGTEFGIKNASRIR